MSGMFVGALAITMVIAFYRGHWDAGIGLLLVIIFVRAAV